MGMCSTRSGDAAVLAGAPRYECYDEAISSTPQRETPIVCLDIVHGSFLADRMWTKAQEIRLGVMMGLRKCLSLIRGMRRSLTEEERHRVADAIVEHLESTNWKIEHAPSAEGHGQRLMP